MISSAWRCSSTSSRCARLGTRDATRVFRDPSRALAKGLTRKKIPASGDARGDRAPATPSTAEPPRFHAAVARRERPLTRRPLPVRAMQNENVQLRLNSIRRLATIATALGPERTRTELVPFLTDSNDDEDECLLAIAEELACLIPKVGGPEHAHVLLAPLENLATVEETVVRDKAVAAACAVGEAMTSEGATTHYVPCVQRLANGDWFTARVSACGMFAVAYRKVADAGVRSDLRKTYAQLCADETPMTRRAAAQHLGAFAGEIEPEHVRGEIMTLFKQLTTDEQDSVRLLAVEDCAKLGKILPREECVADVVPVVKKFAADKSWRVRYMVAHHFCQLCDTVSQVC